MALSITQTPPVLNLAQSPIPITLSENTNLITSSSFQYVLELYYWSGGPSASGSAAQYTLVKYPNESGVGIFDVSRILNSTLTDLLEANPSNVKFFTAEGYTEYLSGSVYVTGSHVRTGTYKYIDGYSIFQEPISQSIWEKTPYWPLMTDGPATQSSFDFNGGTQGVYVGNYGSGSVPNRIVYTSNLGTAQYFLSSSQSSSGQVYDYPIGQNEIGFPFTSSLLSYYTVQAFSGSQSIGLPITFNLTCNQKYPNIRIKWKNRYGQFDWFNFNMINTKEFNVSRQVYQPQIGSWGGSNLSYNRYDSNNLNYLVDTKENIQVNTDWVDEEYNEIFKQLLVSDEIYWVYDEDNNYVRPLTIATSNLVFKTGVVNKVIQYSFEFAYGQTYKLVI
jgi:hypothetical protein